jgi:hypothetical protein
MCSQNFSQALIAVQIDAAKNGTRLVFGIYTPVGCEFDAATREREGARAKHINFLAAIIKRGVLKRSICHLQ